MKFANIDGQRRKAEPALSATCPRCGGAVGAKCGNHRVWHWAHRGVRVCDDWWEPETEWHRNWKDEFPEEWQEIVHTAQSGEKHIADVKNPSAMVVEFQHSFLKAEERIAREAFYRKMVWVVNGCRRKRDAAQLLRSIGRCVFNQPPYILYVTNFDGSALLRDWNDSLMPVYFDLGADAPDGAPILWRRDPISRAGRIYMTPVSRASFLTVHLEGLDAEQKFSQGVSVIVESMRRTAQSPQPLPSFLNYRSRVRRSPRL